MLELPHGEELGAHQRRVDVAAAIGRRRIQDGVRRASEPRWFGSTSASRPGAGCGNETTFFAGP
ncbi:MAG: hypothetical protein A2138_06615 [Deltaproteobacteria bacterium RBG_16_71_12]|nr:MAG: hypothetical protein A2138_06615 [Deltaproteobacteria bacterium RBG_16_71_12]